MDMVSLALGAAGGFIFGTLWNTILGVWKSRQDFQERQLLINKLISNGDPAVNYNLNLTDQVSQAPQTVKAAVNSEVRQRQAVEPEPVAPWDFHPDYQGCDVTFDEENNRVMIFDPNAVDGPDCWDEPMDVFYKKLEEPRLTL